MNPVLTVFTSHEENELVFYLKLIKIRLFGLKLEDFRKLAYLLTDYL